MPDAPHDRTLVLIDGSSYLYRAYHALPDLRTADGHPTGALYGVVGMLHKLIDTYPDARMAVVFDAPGRTFRDDLYAAYKAHRPPMPEDLQAQREPLRRIIAALGVSVLEEPGVEADDVIGTLTARWQGPVVISSSDKDLAQLVRNDHIVLLDTMKDVRTDRAGVEEKFGVPPERVTDYLALVGDVSDNIPGVPRVGPKTAARWLREWGDLDTLIAHAGRIGGKVGESLREHLDGLPLSRELATIRLDVPVSHAPEELRRAPADRDALKDLYRRFEMRRFLREVSQDEDPGSKNADGNAEGAHGDGAAAGDGGFTPAEPECVLDAAAFEAWLERLRAADPIVFDLETDSLSYMNASVVGVALAVPGRAAYIPVDHVAADAPAQLPRDRVLGGLRPLLEDPGRSKLGQNLKYDMGVLARYGIHVQGLCYDTMLESYVLNSTATRHDMDSLAAHYLGYSCTSYEEVCGKGARQIGFAELDVETAARYAAEDADVTLALHRVLHPAIEAVPALYRVLHGIELPLIPVLSRMERHGVAIDADRLHEQSHELAVRMAEVEQQAHDQVGEPFNLGSPKQIQEILFERMALPVVTRTPKGQPSTAESVLEQLADDGYELPRLILEHRGLSKLKSTYTDKLPQLIDPNTGRVHTSYHQAVAATGRLSSSDPNLQNIPVRTAEGRRIRQAFIAEPGHTFMAADYSQIELRIMAHLSQDERLLQAFTDREDIHRATATEVFDRAPEAVDAEQRRAAKAINFGLIYGMSAFGLARQLGIPRDEAQHYIDRYFARYPGVRAFMDRTREEAREQGYVETVFGRRLHLPEIRSRNRQRREYAERTAINAPMQGTAADLIKRAMIVVDQWLSEGATGARLVMQVHDELILEVPDAQVDAVAREVRDAMAKAGDGALSVGLDVDIGTGTNWDEAH